MNHSASTLNPSLYNSYRLLNLLSYVSMYDSALRGSIARASKIINLLTSLSYANFSLTITDSKRLNDYERPGI
jgi:hypothetical protein